MFKKLIFTIILSIFIFCCIFFICSHNISHWKFNTNITGLGKCVRKSMSICMLDSDCSRDEYCVSKKAKLIRDTKRLEDFSEIKILLENYKEVHGYYPKLNAGTYLPNNSISVC